MSLRILTIAILAEHDLVLVRQRSRQLADLLGLGNRQQTRLATAVSEISRNAFQYAGDGKVEFLLERQPHPRLLVRVCDAGPGIARLDDILQGRYRSDTGLGLGLAGARRLVDHFEIESSSEQGTQVLLGVDLDEGGVDHQALLDKVDSLTRTSPGNPFGEVLQQNQELLRAQNELAESHAHLQEAHGAKDRFLAMLAHELRNLLNALRGALEVLKRGPEDASKRREMEDIADQQVRHLGRMIDDLLDASKVVRGTLSLQKRTLDLTEECRRIASAWRPQVEEKHLSLEVEMPRQPVWISADSTRLAQVLGNLISNAVKFTDAEGRIDIRVEAADSQARLSVRDSGCGLDDDGLRKIFEPFTQTKEAKHRMTGGLGLGLAIVKGLVEAHDGRVEAHSDGPGHGLGMEVVFPLEEAPAQAPPGAAEVVREEVDAAETASAVRKILLIDDHEPTLASLSELLRLDGHEVEVAIDGETGLQMASTFQPNWVLCDLGLPGMDGIEVGRRLGELEGASFRKIAVSGYVDPKTKQDALQVGFENVLAKPVKIESLQKLLAEPTPSDADSRGAI